MTKLVHVVDLFGNERRHRNAQVSWERIYANGVQPVHLNRNCYRRSSADIGDNRCLPYINDIFAAGADACRNKTDVVIWTNDDIALNAGIVEWSLGHVYLNGASSMRRNESGHVGRDLFAFTKEWLDQHLPPMPLMFHGAPQWDLVFAAKIRLTHGIRSTLQNLALDLWPSETPDRYALHEPHPSSWNTNQTTNSRANQWNKTKAREWTRSNLPELILG